MQLGAHGANVVLRGGKAVLHGRPDRTAAARDVALGSLDEVVDRVGHAAGGPLSALARVDRGAYRPLDGLAQGFLDVAALGHAARIAAGHAPSPARGAALP